MLLKFIIEKIPLVFKNNDTKFSVSVFEFLIIIYFVLFIYEQSNTYKIMYDFILILIISIWFGVAKKFYNRIKNLKYIYNENSDYNNLYKKYNSSVFNWNLSRFFFIIIWIFNIGFVCYTVESLGLIPNSFSSKILFSITLILNGSSYYCCILHACFLAKLSSLKLDDLKHNNYLPSCSSEIQQLVIHSSENSLTFLIVSILYNCLYITTLLCDNSNMVSEISGMINFQLLTVTLVVLSFFTCIVITILPKIYINRMVFHWKMNTLQSLEKSLNIAEIDNDKNKIQECITYISVLSKDQIKYNYYILEIIITITSLILNVLNIANLIYK